MIFVFDSYILDTGRRELRSADKVVSVQPQVFDLLEYLIRNRDRVVTKDDMLAAIWGGRIVSESTLATRINAARNAIGDDGVSQRFIRTLPRKGLRFVGAVREMAAEAVPAAAPTAETAAPPVAARVDAERRYLTLAACDFVGLRDLATRLDPEELSAVIDACHACCSQVAADWGGSVGQASAHGATLYFSYPQAHEDDAERAVRAGLDLLTRIAAPDIGRGNRLAARIGIATGLVVIGGLGNAVGAAPALASALCAAAPAGGMLIARSTRSLLGNLFDCTPAGPFSLDGFSDPVSAWSVTASRAIESRFEAMRAANLTALVGREEETELLLRRWTRIKSGAGQVVLLSGEAGIGKSRLTAELLAGIAGEPHTRLRYFCSPQRTDSALFPIIGLLERVAGLEHDDTVPVKLDKLDAAMAQTSSSAQDTALFAEMLSLPSDGRYPALDLPPPLRRQKTLAALTYQMEALTRRTPTLMVLEDAHWADATTLELLALAVDRIATLRLLLIVTARPEFTPPWIGRAHVTALTINRLGEHDVAALIDKVGGGEPLPDDIRAQIVARSDGVPLFVEEMTRAVLESAGPGTIGPASAPGTIDVPASLHASLMARLDRLGPVKEVAQVGAAIGREFPHGLLGAAVGGTEAELAPALERLIQSGLLFRQGVPPHANYLFKHALVRDAAYGTLLREPRRALHARIAQILESDFPEVAESQPEVLARHLTEAGLTAKAASLWGKAGQRSLQRSALVEAIEQLSRALALVNSLPSTPALRREQIKLQVALITPLIHVKGYAAPETQTAAEQARLLIEQAEARGEPLEDPLLLFSVLYGFWVANRVAFNGELMLKLAGQFLALAQKKSATVPLMIGHRIMGISLTCAGAFAESRTHYDQANALYDPTTHAPLATRFGQDVRVSILSYRSLTLWFLGYPEAALADAREAVEYSRSIGQAASLMYALAHSCLGNIHCGNYRRAAAQAEELISLAGEKSTLIWKAFGMMNQGRILTLNGNAAAGLEIIAAGIAAAKSTGATLLAPIYLSYFAQAHGALGQYDAAWRCTNEAIAAVEKSKESWCEAEVHRTAGEIALMAPQPDVEQVAASFERALAVARGQQAKSWELRVATSYAQLLRDRGEARAARALLAPVYDWFTEGFDTLDLKKARALLGELGAV